MVDSPIIARREISRRTAIKWLSGGAVAAAAGCDVREEGGPALVTIWEFGGVPYRRTWIRETTERFNATNDSIQIDLALKDWDTQRENLVSALLVGDGPDIISVHHKYAVEFGELGGLLPLEQFADFGEIASRFFPSTLELVAYKGQHYGIPATMMPFVLAVNNALLAQNALRVPRTWEELLEMGPILKQRGLYTLAMPGGANLDTAYRFLPLLYKAGGRVFNDDWSAAAFNGPAGLGALKLLATLKDEGFMPAASAAYKFDENAALWTSEKAVFSIEGPWFQGIIKDNFDFDTGKLGLAPVPGPANALGPHEPGTLLDVVMTAIPSYSGVPELAWDVLKTLYVEDDVWGRPNPAMGSLATQRTAYEYKDESGYVDLDVMMREAQIGIGWPGHPAITEVQRLIADAVNSVLAGQQAPREALDAAAYSVDELLNEY